MLNERLFTVPGRTSPSLPTSPQRTDVTVHIRAIENWSSALSMCGAVLQSRTWRRSHGKARRPWAASGLWRDAYGAISRAARLEVVGYSMPPDDIEIRTIFAPASSAALDLDEVIVRNPTPDVHDRIRRISGP